MANHSGDSTNIEVLKLQLSIARENRLAEERRLLVEEKRRSAEEQKRLAEEVKLKQKQLDLAIEEERTKRMKIEYQCSSSTKNSQSSFSIAHREFYNANVNNNRYSLNRDDFLLNNGINIDDDVMNYIEKQFDALKLSTTKILENDVQKTFDEIICYILTKYDHVTKLKYLKTCRSPYLSVKCNVTIRKYSPDCSFIYKNINVQVPESKQCLQDFVVCAGELKGTDKSIHDLNYIGQLCQYLTLLLDIQERNNMYGFLSNMKEIQFYYVEKQPNSKYKYYHSNIFKFYNDLHQTTTTDNTNTSIEVSKQSCLNKDGWNMLVKFLTMNETFYNYTTFNLNTDDYLRKDRYCIIRKLGKGLTGRVYLLKKNCDNNLTNDDPICVLKISKNNLYSKLMLNEVKIIRKLKEFDKSNKFNLFFEDIIESSIEGKIFFY